MRWRISHFAFYFSTRSSANFANWFSIGRSISNWSMPDDWSESGFDRSQHCIISQQQCHLPRPSHPIDLYTKCINSKMKERNIRQRNKCETVSFDCYEWYEFIVLSRSLCFVFFAYPPLSRDMHSNNLHFQFNDIECANRRWWFTHSHAA